MTVPILSLTDAQRNAIVAAAETAYPDECCGIIFGIERTVGGVTERLVDEIEPVPNDFEPGEQHHRFSIPPGLLLRAFNRCHGSRKVLGFYHSHPDHPARPSEYDRVHAWGFYSYLIMAVGRGKAGDLTGWMLNERTDTFESQPVRIG